MIRRPNLFLLLFIFGISILCAQQNNQTEILDKKINENRDLALSNPEKYIENVKILLQEALKAKDHHAELRLLGQRCWYFNRKMELDKAIKAIQHLQSKAIEYKDVYHQALAHQYLSHTYALSNLPDKSVSEFKEGISLLNEMDSNLQDVKYSKMNMYFTVSNAYLEKKDYGQMVSALLNANKEIEKFDNKDLKRQMLSLSYSNLGTAYEKINDDSAAYYAEQSILLKNAEEKFSTTQFVNHMVLGLIYNKKQDYPRAIYNLREAENIAMEITPERINLLSIYNNLAEIYKKTDSLALSKDYTQKSNALQLEIEINKNKSLHTIIQRRMLEDERKIIYLSIGFLIVITGLLVGLFYFRKKNKLLQKQEILSQQYLGRLHEKESQQKYSDLIEMVKNNDPAFLVAFHKTFPEFTERIKAVSNQLVSTEVEFCALLKLNLSTKEIARYKNVEPKSIQTRKYRIRKKLNIPDEEDIYFWFNKI